MEKKLVIPQDLMLEPQDSSVDVSWSPVKGANGYVISLFNAQQPEVCIKKRYAGGTSKHILGLVNGREYLVSVCAYYYDKNTEVLGPATEKLSVVPVSVRLKAQNVICIKVGEITTLKWEANNKIPKAYFHSDNEEVATVGNGGLIQGVSEGTASVTVTAGSEKYTTLVHVGRNRPAPDVRAVMLFAGDLMCTVNHQSTAAQRGFDFFDCFADVRRLLREADYSVGVLETACLDSEPYEYEMLRHEDGEPNCNSPSTFITAAANAGFDAMVTANNHIADAGYDGIAQTVAAIKRQGMANVGAMGDGVIMRVVRGFKVAFIASTMIKTRIDPVDKRTEGQQTFGGYSRKRFETLVAKARSVGAEYIVSFVHWGSMNTRSVTEAQLQEAQFMADCGADIIVGSHPHVVQEVRYITSEDGRKVPCAFSIGNFMSSQYELAENRDSVLLRVELVRGKDRLISRVSYIPCHSFDTTGGVTVRPIYPTFSEGARQAMERIMINIGDNVKPYVEKPRLLLSGSVILDRIFRGDSRFSTDRNALLLSQVSACAGTGVPSSESKALKLDMEKSFADYVVTCGADCAAVDFYAAAAISCYKRGDALYTGSKAFLESKFYKNAPDSFERLKPPFAKAMWRESIKKYAEALLKAFAPDRIILYKHTFSEKAVNGTELRLTAPHDNLNKRIADMEEYFISLVRPAVVDLSRCYFNAGGSLAEFEQEYFTDAANAAEQILSRGRTYVDRADPELWYDRMLRYYQSITARGNQSWMLNMRCAADMLIAYTGEAFAARHRGRLLRLKRLGKSELSQVHGFFAGDRGAGELVAAAELINAVLSGDISQDYDVYAPAFREKWNIVMLIAKLLSVELQVPINAESAELAFLLRGSPAQLKEYLGGIKKITVDIWGSDLSKRIVDECTGARVGRYIFGQCPLLTNDALVPITVPQDDMQFSGNSWRRTMTEEAFSRMGMFRLTQSGSKWLIIDFYNAVAQMNEIDGGLFVVDEFLQNTEFYKSIRSRCTPCYLFEKRNMQQCQAALKRFTEDLSYRYGKNIILVKTDLKDRYISLSDRMKQLPEDSYYELKRKFIALCEKYFIDYTGCFVLDIARLYHASDRHPMGAGNVNYEKEFYSRAAEYISYVIQGGTTRLYDKADEAHIKLRDLRLNRN